MSDSITVPLERSTSGAPLAVRSNFGPRGWSMVGFSLIMYYNFAAWTADGLNVIVQSFVDLHGWDFATLLAFSTPAGWLGVIGSLMIAELINRKGAKIVAIVGLVLLGLVLIWFGRVTSPMEYAVGLTLINFLATGVCFNVPGTLLNTWFPRKKGLALGWATMGMSLCTATLVPIMVLLFGVLGIPNAYAACGLILIALGLATIVWVRNSPEEAGCYPDNEPLSREQLAANLAELESHRSPFTIPVLLRDRDMWLISLGYGLLWLVDIGVVSQLVPRLISIGYDQSTAIFMFTTAAFFCAIFSYVWGWLDVRFGTRRVSIAYALFFVFTHACLMVKGGDVFTYFTLLLVGMSIAGIKELATSQVGSVYGRYDFAAANRVISTIACLFRVCCFAVIAASLKWTGGYDAAYGAFIVLDLVAAVLIYFITDTCKGKVDPA
ncbi:MFS transporter [Rhodoplanes sp. TEM]|uniref:MFS transporter n=1 Tax=Rhodoplanes tepidamans TaxID=200616 RepID=A0ABT5JBK6_RHOTP|nr:MULTISPECIES: MFS transporter [Rhodoplanes]MDC7787066.1 MFS transporter [Rhodoplanes tepidamans]MDC7987767.1 MFS transporter [Rhodoplanes sp. TEM]MDQ0359045.1 MFS family permease [Rhodoplanes tepidamans]